MTRASMSLVTRVGGISLPLPAMTERMAWGLYRGNVVVVTVVVVTREGG
jgi:hypothetical protein